MASLRMGPRQTMSGLRSSQAKERTQADEAPARRRSRWVSGLWSYQSTVGIGRCLPGDVEGRLVDLALRAGHGAGLVVAHEEGEVLAEHLAQLGGHHQRGDGAERETLLRVHQLLLVPPVERRLLQLQPLGGL